VLGGVRGDAGVGVRAGRRRADGDLRRDRSSPDCGSSSTAVLAPTYVATGVGGKATVQFSGVNAPVVNGSGSETTINGEGNLVIGYNPSPGTQTGSHNLLLGTGGQSDTSYGGIDVGFNNVINNPSASVLGGTGTKASGPGATVTGGFRNNATGSNSWVGGQRQPGRKPSFRQRRLVE
jgi:hypothetical protein